MLEVRVLQVARRLLADFLQPPESTVPHCIEEHKSWKGSAQGDDAVELLACDVLLFATISCP